MDGRTSQNIRVVQKQSTQMDVGKSNTFLLLRSNSLFTGTIEMRAITLAACAQVLTDSRALEPISRNAIWRTDGYSKPSSPNKILHY
jgi:hypothetical protein